MQAKLVTFLLSTILSVVVISSYTSGSVTASLGCVHLDNGGWVLWGIAPNALSDRIGVFNTMAPVALLLGVIVLGMLGVHNAAGMIAEEIVTGFFGGVVIALPPVCFRVLTANKSMIGTHIGQGFAIGRLGLLIGGPSAGAVLWTREPLDWTGLWVYGVWSGASLA